MEKVLEGFKGPLSGPGPGAPSKNLLKLWVIPRNLHGGQSRAPQSPQSPPKSLMSKVSFDDDLLDRSQDLGGDPETQN